MCLQLDQSPSPQAARQATTQASGEQQFHHPNRIKGLTLLMKSHVRFKNTLHYCFNKIYTCSKC